MKNETIQARFQAMLDGLNPAQKIAVTCENLHTMVLAGAGCGKTKTIVARAAFLIQQGVDPQKIQLLTFTRRAANELTVRIRSCIGERSNGLQAGTFHAWCMTLIRRAPKVFGLEQCTVIDTDDQEQLMKIIRGSHTTKSHKTPQATALLAFYSYTRNTGKKFSESVIESFPEAEASEPFRDTIKNILMDYEKRKRQNNYLDYDDILQIVAEHLAQSSNVLNWVSSLYEHILVDEMQDTNPLQWRLLEPLTRSTRLYCVGDARQSIYKFRGADFENVNSFSKRLPNSQTLYLEENYRSTQEILDLSNWMLSKSQIQYGPPLIAVRGLGNSPVIMSFSDELQEASWLGNDLLRRNADGAPFPDHMILIRSAYAGRAIEASLIACGIPYKFIGGHKIMESAHIRDVLSLVRLVGNFRDELAWMRFLCLYYSVGEKTAAALINQFSEATSLTDCGKVIAADNGLPVNISTAITELASTENITPKKAYDTSCRVLHDLLAKKYENQHWDSRKRDFSLVSSLAEKHETVLGFLEEYVLNPVSETEIRDGEDVKPVILSTIHSAKGAEAKVCYVINVSANAFPHSKACQSQEDVEEERRVLYVALTRAENELIVTRQNFNTWSTRLKLRPKSEEIIDPVAEYFLNELPPGMVIEEVSDEDRRLIELVSLTDSRKIEVGMNFS